MSTSVDTEPTTDISEKPPLQLEIQVETPQACLREVIVTIPRSDVDRYLKDAYDELVPEAQVPGFRAGRAPRKLVEKQFKDRIEERVKGSLLMDSLSQATESSDFNAIGEPDFDFESIDLPSQGSFKYQFRIEVRPEFPTPNWKGLTLERPVETISDTDVDAAMKRVLSRYAELEATDEPIEKGDKILVTAKFTHDGKTVSEMDEERITVSERLSLSDGICEEFGKVCVGAKEGDVLNTTVKLSDSHAEESLQGASVEATFNVVEVFKLQMPELTADFLDELGEFESEEELREFVKSSLQRQANFRTEQAMRREIVGQLTAATDFELPPTLVRKQTRRELDRKILEFRRSGLDEDMIRRLVNANRQNIEAETSQSLREHFVLEQVAEDEKIDAAPEEYDKEIELIAEQSDQSPRQVRARLEKTGQMDGLRNQIVERKVIELITESGNVTDKPVAPDETDEYQEFALYHDVVPTKDPNAIPEAKYDDHTPKGAEDPDREKQEKD